MAIKNSSDNAKLDHSLLAQIKPRPNKHPIRCAALRAAARPTPRAAIERAHEKLRARLRGDDA
jgi:hypothetical protein